MPLKRATGEVAAQWDKFVGAFSRPRTALLFHLTNHYALIAAVRSYAGEDGEPVREVFTARKGQTPRVWIPFDEAPAPARCSRFLAH